MDDLGPPVAYSGLADGTPVFDRNGQRIGVVEHVLADTALDIFHGVIAHTHPLPGRHLYADADQIAELHERGVVLAVDESQLHEPDETSPRTQDDAHPETSLEARIRHAWDWIRAHT
jgi:uncharacterized protein YrrD